MIELFKTVLILSLFGFLITALLLILKPMTMRKLPARWQYWVWIAVLISMIIPIYKFIPKQEAQKLTFVAGAEIVHTETVQNTEIITEPAISESSVVTKTDTEVIKQSLIEMTDVFAYLWVLGMVIYLAVVVISYIIYILKKRKNSFCIEGNEVFDDVKRVLNIKRNIKLKMSEDMASPMLVGIFHPTVYIPARDIPDENLKMVFMHELTHYKRGDLIIKWLALLVNAIHWFNPLAYILCANVGEACEVSCDMAVTRNMSEEDQKTYMKTILELVE